MASPSAICHLPAAPRILIRGTNWLGDAVMTTPALLRLREKYPDAARDEEALEEGARKQQLQGAGQTSI